VEKPLTLGDSLTQSNSYQITQPNNYGDEDFGKFRCYRMYTKEKNVENYEKNLTKKLQGKVFNF
jgi:hypothetical protein